MHRIPLILTGLAALCALPTLPQAQAFPYSQSPPGGLAANQVPMFVCLGFDDNARVEGIDYFADLMRDRRNPPGTGNARTFDGAPVRGTWFITSSYAAEGFIPAGTQTAQDVVNAWKRLYQDGHEIANHTWNHPHGFGLTLDAWKDQIQRANNLLVQSLGMPASAIKGFRTPFLEYNAQTFQALKDLGFQYDCSIEFGFDGWTPVPPDTGYWNSPINPETHKKLYWPYTLDNGSPPGNASRGNPTIAGLWEVPVYTYIKPANDGVYTGFDYNIWKFSDKAQFVATLKKNFDLRRAGNRNPLTINLHSDNYTQYNVDANREFTLADWRQRQEGMKEFLDYVLQFPETRVVSYASMLGWMKDPVGLGGISGISKGKLKEAAGSARLTRDGGLEVTAVAAGSYGWELVNARGRVVAKGRQDLGVGRERLELAGVVNPGLYWLRLSGGGNKVVQRVVLGV